VPTAELGVRRDATSTIPESASAAALYATCVLFFTNLVGYLDRSILTLVVDPIKASLRLSDGEIGLMQGAAFVVTFTIAGLFIGRLIDSYNRRNLLIVCVAIWSVSAAACGLAQEGWQLFVGRMGVGVGEAALIPTAVSLIADYFPPEKRGKAYGFFTTGIYAGNGTSLVVVGLALAGITTFSATLAARGVALEPWRLVMLAMIVPGVVSCLLLATMREPVRIGRGRVEETGGTSVFRAWLASRGVLLPHHLAIAFATLGLYGINAWMPQVLMREYAMAPREAGVMYGTLVAVVGIISAYGGGILSDYAARRAGTAGRLLLAMILIMLGTAGFVMLALVSGRLALMIGSVIVLAPLSASVVTGIVALAELAEPRFRGQFTSIYFVFAGVIGAAGGPAVVGYANDLLKHRGIPLSASLAVVGTVATTIAVVSAWLAWRRSVKGRFGLTVLTTERLVA
jgi:MFS family permease